MDEREKAELRAVSKLVEHEGWAVLMRQTQEKLDLFRSGLPLNIRNIEELFFAKGVVVTLTELLNTAARVEQAQQSQIDEIDLAADV